MIYSSHNGFRIKSEIKLSEYNCNQDLVSGKTENQIGFSISDTAAVFVTYMSNQGKILMGIYQSGLLLRQCKSD